MKKKLVKSAQLLALAGILVFSASCASGIALSKAKRQLKQGDAVGAVLFAAQSVAKDIKNYKAIDYLVSIYPAAVADRTEAADIADRSQGKYRLEDIVAAISDLHAMFDAVSRLPPVYRKKSTVSLNFPVAYQKERLASAKAGAAELRYAEGLAFAAQGTRKAWREAHRRFVKSLAYVPGYLDAETRAGEARELGSDKVLVLPFSSSSSGELSADLGFISKDDTLSTLVGRYLSTLVKGDNISSELATFFYNSYLSTIVAEAGKQQYVRVVERSVIEDLLREREIAVSALADGRVKLESLGIQGANVIVFGQLSGIVQEQPHESSKTIKLQAVVEQPIPGASPVNGVVPLEKITVYATLTTHTKTSALSASFSLRAVNAENSLLVDAVSKTQTERDTKEWAEYSGDKRALTDTYLRLTEKREESVRSPREMMSDLAMELIPPAVKSLLLKLPLE